MRCSPGELTGQGEDKERGQAEGEGLVELPLVPGEVKVPGLEVGAVGSGSVSP